MFRDGRQIATITKTSYVDKGLKAKSTHSYYVRAFDASNNESASSRSVSATTLAQKDTSPPTAPRSLHACFGLRHRDHDRLERVDGQHWRFRLHRHTERIDLPTDQRRRSSPTPACTDTTYNYSVRRGGRVRQQVDSGHAAGVDHHDAGVADTDADTDGHRHPRPDPVGDRRRRHHRRRPRSSGVTANVGSVDASDPANCTVTISVTVRVDDGDLPSGSLVHWDGTGIGSGDVGGSYTEGSNNFTIGTFTVTVDGSVTVTIDGFSDSGSWNAPAACNAPTDPPTTDGRHDSVS